MNWSPGFSLLLSLETHLIWSFQSYSSGSKGGWDGSDSKPSGGEVQMNLFLLACQSSAHLLLWGPVLSRPGTGIFLWPKGWGHCSSPFSRGILTACFPHLVGGASLPVLPGAGISLFLPFCTLFTSNPFMVLSFQYSDLVWKFLISLASFPCDLMVCF